MTEIKNGDTVVVDLNIPASSWHKAEGVLVEKSSYNKTGGKVRITKLSPNYDKERYGSKKVGDEAKLVNLTKAPGFRVGTKALFTGKVTGFEGQTVTVTETIMSGAYDYRVSRADGALCPVHHHELQRIEEPVAPKLKVGDRVTIKGYEAWIPGVFEGRTGVVVDTYNGPHSVKVEFSDTKPHKWGTFGVVYAVPAEPAEPEPKFKIGDWVKVQGRNDSWDGTVGTVQKIRTEIAYHGLPLYVIHKTDSKRALTFFEDHLVASEAPKVPAAAPYPTKEELKFVWDAPAKAEAVDGPAHYGGKDNPYEAIKVAEAWGFNEKAYLFNALKYLARAGKKGDKVEDLKKLVFYVEREIALEEASGN